MQVKDYLTALVDENKLRVEKIGSGNWYWCFKGDEKRKKENEVLGWRKEVEALEIKAGSMREEIEREQDTKEGGHEMKVCYLRSCPRMECPYSSKHTNM